MKRSLMSTLGVLALSLGNPVLANQAQRIGNDALGFEKRDAGMAETIQNCLGDNVLEWKARLPDCVDQGINATIVQAESNMQDGLITSMTELLQNGAQLMADKVRDAMEPKVTDIIIALGAHGAYIAGAIAATMPVMSAMRSLNHRIWGDPIENLLAKEKPQQPDRSETMESEDSIRSSATLRDKQPDLEKSGGDKQAVTLPPGITYRFQGEPPKVLAHGLIEFLEPAYRSFNQHSADQKLYSKNAVVIDCENGATKAGECTFDLDSDSQLGRAVAQINASKYASIGGRIAINGDEVVSCLESRSPTNYKHRTLSLAPAR